MRNDPTGHCTDPDENCPQLSTSTPPFRATSTPIPGFNNNGLPNPPQLQITPTPGETYNPNPSQPPQIGPSNNEPVLTPQISIDWTKVDKIDFGIDAIGTISSGVEIAFPETVPILGPANGIVQAIGLGKSAIELVQGDPQSALFTETNNTAQKVVLMAVRVEKIAPWVGIVGNIVSLGFDLRNSNPHIEWEK